MITDLPWIIGNPHFHQNELSSFLLNWITLSLFSAKKNNFSFLKKGREENGNLIKVRCGKVMKVVKIHLSRTLQEIPESKYPGNYCDGKKLDESYN